MVSDLSSPLCVLVNSYSVLARVLAIIRRVPMWDIGSLPGLPGKDSGRYYMRRWTDPVARSTDEPLVFPCRRESSAEMSPAAAIVALVAIVASTTMTACTDASSLGKMSGRSTMGSCVSASALSPSRNCTFRVF